MLPSRVLLFDVDGTLITARGAGRSALGRALEETFGRRGPIETYDIRGKTDPRIVRDLMLAAGDGEARIRALMPACLRAYAAALADAVGDGSRVETLPGVAELVRALGARGDLLLGLLTGNVETGALLKLGPTGLWPYFRVGAYGSDDPDRTRLPAIAAARVERLTGAPVSMAQLTIIGDTPLDVECARACGAVAVAVATGQHGFDELRACGPDLIFRDFGDVPAAVARLVC